MTDEVLIGREGAMGIVTLNRPKAINALSQEMIDTIYAALLDWQNDDTVKAVLFEGNGERGFCAGGDVRASRQMVLDGEVEAALGFYDHEYRNNALIATYAKPVVAIGHGIVMGGGIGLHGHAGIRIAVEGAKYAMPETAIGLFCDIGVNARLATVPVHRALLFEFLGTPVGPADAMALDLCDMMVPQAAVPELRQALISAAAAGREALAATASRFAVDAGEAVFSAVADRLAPAFTGRTAASIVQRLGELAEPEDAELMAVIGRRCPTSLEAVLQTYWLALEDHGIETVLRRDLALARYLTVRGDFAEGVRSVLVDKDNVPVWDPPSAADVDRKAIGAVLASV